MIFCNYNTLKWQFFGYVRLNEHVLVLISPVWYSLLIFLQEALELLTL